MDNVISPNETSNKVDFLASPDAGAARPTGAESWKAPLPENLGGGPQTPNTPQQFTERRHPEERIDQERLRDVREELRKSSEKNGQGTEDSSQDNSSNYGTVDRVRHTLDDQLQDALDQGNESDLEKAKTRFTVLNHVVQTRSQILERRAIDQGLGAKGDKAVIEFVNHHMNSYQAADALRLLATLGRGWAAGDINSPVVLNDQSIDRTAFLNAADEVSVQLFSVASETATPDEITELGDLLSWSKHQKGTQEIPLQTSAVSEPLERKDSTSSSQAENFARKKENEVRTIEEAVVKRQKDDLIRLTKELGNRGLTLRDLQDPAFAGSKYGFDLASDSHIVQILQERTTLAEHVNIPVSEQVREDRRNITLATSSDDPRSQVERGPVRTAAKNVVINTFVKDYVDQYKVNRSSAPTFAEQVQLDKQKLEEAVPSGTSSVDALKRIAIRINGMTLNAIEAQELLNALDSFLPEQAE